MGKKLKDWFLDEKGKWRHLVKIEIGKSIAWFLDGKQIRSKKYGTRIVMLCKYLYQKSRLDYPDIFFIN